MRRWYSGGWQNLKKHYTVISKPNNSLQLALTYFEGLVFSFAIFVFPLINIKFFSHFTTANAAQLVGLWRYITGIRSGIWEPTVRNQ